MIWTAVIPFKGAAERKTRLAGILSPDQRRKFSQRMFEHVRDVLAACVEVDEVALLSDVPASGWGGLFFLDEGRGLNAELTALALSRPGRPMLIIHADLPLLHPPDISVLLAEAEKAGCAIAPDRNGSGTNALAFVDPAGFAFHFGTDSMARHLRASGGRASIVKREGLSFDIDTPEDYREACRIAPDVMKQAVS
ncbi:2-phospho-L-lactate guanylyltransferase [Rhizorhapis suberifaciens]|uniref:3-phospho-D-glycerate guanylyltransferase n=1 Tax=Rhizorhapis suberifaciens TaxID=13656 RepID=A0A840HU69_9SPHN|nr:2-phospho-L-lactate guanylyltransferase [Rhizorhapis suberifaciens]MBB4641149.1 2-phospho-L-lactate guanylyltransferase [Rhizorhapis suberifaciens]